MSLSAESPADGSDDFSSGLSSAAIERGEERRAVFSAEGFAFPPEARLVVFPDGEGSRLAWEVRVAEPSLFTSYVIVVDAADWRLLYRENTTLYAEAAYLHGEAPDPMTEEFAPAAYFR